MICKKCGAKLKDGCLYCSVCGQEVQIVPDYNILENDIIDSYIGTTEKKNSFEDTSGIKGTRSLKKRILKRKRLFMAGATFGIIGIIFLGIWINQLVTDYEHKNSFDYQYERGIEYTDSGEYQKALPYLEQALALNSADRETLLLLSKTQIELEE